VRAEVKENENDREEQHASAHTRSYSTSQTQENQPCTNDFPRVQREKTFVLTRAALTRVKPGTVGVVLTGQAADEEKH